MTLSIVLGLVLALTTGAVSLALLVFGLPGAWVLLGVAVVHAWATDFAVVGWGMLAWLAGLAVLGEGLELWLSAGAAAAERPSWRTSLGAVAGSLLGAIAGAPFFFGAGALFGALVGAFLGAGAATAWEGGSGTEALAAGRAAMRGRWFGFVVKVGLVATMSVSWAAAILH